MLATPLCLMGPVEVIFLLIALGKLRLMKNFHPPESCRKSTLVLNLGLPHTHLSYFQPYTQAIQDNKEQVHFESCIVRAWCEGEPGTSGRMGIVGRAGRCPGCSGTLLGAPSPTPVGPGPPQCLLIWPPCAHVAPEYTGGPICLGLSEDQ